MDDVLEISPHAFDSMDERDATEYEVRFGMMHGREASARPPRLAREAAFRSGYYWRGKHYPHKLVRPIYAYEADRQKCTVVTVLTFCGVWE